MDPDLEAFLGEMVKQTGQPSVEAMGQLFPNELFEIVAYLKFEEMQKVQKGPWKGVLAKLEDFGYGAAEAGFMGPEAVAETLAAGYQEEGERLRAAGAGAQLAYLFGRIQKGRLLNREPVGCCRGSDYLVELTEGGAIGLRGAERVQGFLRGGTAGVRMPA